MTVYETGQSQEPVINNWPKWSLATTVSLLILGISLLCFSVLLFVEWRILSESSRQATRQEIEAIGTRVSALLPGLLAKEPTGALQSELDTLRISPHSGPAVIIDNREFIQHASDPGLNLVGKHLPESGVFAPSRLVEVARDSGEAAIGHCRDLDRWVGVFPIEIPHQHGSFATRGTYYLIFSHSRSANLDALWPYIWPRALAVATMLVLIVGCLWWLLRRTVVEPIRRMTLCAQTLAEGNAPCASAPQSGRELTALADAMKSLADMGRIETDEQRMHQRMYAAVEELEDEVFICRADDFSIISANKSSCRRLGYTAEEMRALKPWDFVQEHTEETMYEAIASLAGTDSAQYDCEGTHVCKDGSTYRALARMHYIGNASPPLLLAFVQDVTELRHHQETNRLLERAMATVSEGVMITDPSPEDRRILYVNHALCEMSDYSADELIGQSPEILCRTQADQPELEKIQQAMRHAGSGQVRLDLTGKDNTHYITDLSYSPIFDQNGTLTHYMSILRDVTQRLQEEERQKQAQKIRAIGTLSGGLAHDFNNLLGVIIGNLELLRNDTIAARQLELIDGAERAVHIGAHLTRRLLAFASQQTLAPMVTNVNDRVHNAVALLESTIGENINLSVELTPEPWSTLIDPGEIETALINLTINSRDAMPEGGNITIRSENVELLEQSMLGEAEIRAGDYVCLQVCDNGPGMSIEVQARMLEPFFTTKDHPEGSGLGLASVYGFAKQSGGYLNMSSVEGGGTTVSIYLPRHIEKGAAMNEVGELAQRPATARVLVVEDKDMLRSLTCKQLQLLGCETLEAVDGSDAIAQLESDPALDVVMSDIVMPGGVSGYDVVSWINQNRPGCRVLLTSGYNDAIEKMRSSEFEGVQFLAKPFRMHDLQIALHEVMGLYETQSSAASGSV